MNIIELNVNEIIPYENNPRNNDEAIDKVAESIKEFGFRVPIIIDRDNVIIAGHTRLFAAKKLGMEYIPCIYAEGLTKEQIRAYRLADNKVAEFSTWDMDKLEQELSMLGDMDMTQFGFEKILEHIEEEDEDSPYSMATNVPQYDITGDVPEISELIDEGKTNELIAEIDSALIGEEEKDFLRKAAQRHLAFNYSKIAEFYASASPEVQELMEKSALVIIDYDDAILYGYTSLSEKIQKMLEADKQ